VMIGGEPGVGKTRLSHELLAMCAREGFQTFVGHCYEMAGPSRTSPSSRPSSRPSPRLRAPRRSGNSSLTRLRRSPSSSPGSASSAPTSLRPSICPLNRSGATCSTACGRCYAARREADPCCSCSTTSTGRMNRPCSSSSTSPSG
jgi:hypothetical protein